MLFLHHLESCYLYYLSLFVNEVHEENANIVIETHLTFSNRYVINLLKDFAESLNFICYYKIDHIN